MCVGESAVPGPRTSHRSFLIPTSTVPYVSQVVFSLQIFPTKGMHSLVIAQMLGHAFSSHHPNHISWWVRIAKDAIISILTLTVQLSNRMKFVHLFTVRYTFNQITEVNLSLQVKYSHQQPYSPFKIIDRGSFFCRLCNEFCVTVWALCLARYSLSAGGGYEHKVCVTCPRSPLSGQCEKYVHVLVGVLTLWPETFLGNAVLRFQRLLHRSARLVLYCLSLRFPTERVLGICRLRSAYTSIRSPCYMFIYALFKP